MEQRTLNESSCKVFILNAGGNPMEQRTLNESSCKVFILNAGGNPMEQRTLNVQPHQSTLDCAKM